MQNQNLAVKSKTSGNDQICLQSAAKSSNLNESQALPNDQILARSSRASSSQNRSQILNSTKAKTSSENPTQSPKNRSNLISLNAAKGSCFSSGANLQPNANQTALSAIDQDALLDEFKAFLSAHLPSSPSFHPCFDEALSYTLKSGGKHFRAMLVAGVVVAVRPERKEAAFHVALAFETMHSYSLIHDDLPAMDDSDLRRGQPSLHVKFDEVTAILAGDALNTHAFYQIAKAPLDADARIKCVEILSQNAGIYGMALGQAVDCYFENQKLGLEELKFLHIHKTARLIAASLQAGCVVAGLDEAEAAHIYDIGLDLGLAFQIADDIIDATQSAETAGKPTHNDGAKNSFTNLLGVDGAVQAKNELISKIECELCGVHAGIRAIVTGLIDKHLR
nr:polyprenyl synthetase family protein [Campylobacter showae]